MGTVIWLILIESMRYICGYRSSCGCGTRKCPLSTASAISASLKCLLVARSPTAFISRVRAPRSRSRGSWGSHKQGNVACGKLRFYTRHRLYPCFVEQIRFTASTPLHCLETFLATHAIVTYNSHLTRTYIINLIKALYIYELERTFWQVFTCPLWP